jgi:hypothetical protein
MGTVQRSLLAAICIGIAPAVSACAGQTSATPPAAPSVTAAVPDSVTVPGDMVGKNAGDAQSELARGGLAGQISSSNSDCLTTPSLCAVSAVPQAGATVAGGTNVVLDAVPISTWLAGAAQPTPTVDAVIYTVTGKRAGTITYQNAAGDASQVTGTTKLPWTLGFAEPSGAEGLLYVSAQNAGSGTIGCSISINGTVVKQNTSTGTYAIVECSE